MPTVRPPAKDHEYNQELSGHYGEFGSGGGAKVVFVQSALSPLQLDKISLVGEISGAEKWPVRDLFQREVDVDRITNGLLPWLQDESQVKFFNPLTLAVLPVGHANDHIIRQVGNLCPGRVRESEVEWETLEKPGFFRFRHMVGHREYGALDWNDTCVRIVAVDGQHRLSALKRFQRDLAIGDKYHAFLQWSIPVVICGLHSVGNANSLLTLLDVIRHMFVYINTRANPPSKARQILLDDDSINNICAQELLEYSHQNDVIEDPANRDHERVPLLLYDWRGATEGGQHVHSPAALKSVVEIRDWFEHLLLGEDGQEDQLASLGILEGHSLFADLRKGRVSCDHVDEVRRIFGAGVLPGLSYLLKEFEPYKRYIAGIRKLESRLISKGDVARHAFDKLRFGTDSASPDVRSKIDAIYLQIVSELTDLKVDVIPELLRLDIGMRGVIYGFGWLRFYISEWEDASQSWLDYAEWYVRQLNSMFHENWFHQYGDKRDLFLHVTRGPSGNIANYRLKDIPNALGAVVACVACAYGGKREEVPNPDERQNVWDEFGDALRATLVKGYKSEARAEYRDRITDRVQLREKTARIGEQRATRHLKQFFQTLESIE